MPIMMISLSIRVRKPRPKADLRTIARAVADLQRAEGMELHAHRDRCILHALQTAVTRRHCTPLVPRRLMRNPDWVHRHIEAPGVRIQARLEDQWRAEA